MSPDPIQRDCRFDGIGDLRPIVGQFINERKILHSTGTLKTYILYYCTRARKQRGVCSQRHYTNAELIEAQLAREVAQLSIFPTFKHWALAVLAKQHTQVVEDQAKRAAMHRKELNDTQLQLDNLIGLLPRATSLTM